MNTVLIFLLFVFLISLISWAKSKVKKTEHVIAVFGIIGAMLTTIISIFLIGISSEANKQLEIDLIITKEKQKAYEHFYNAFFIMLDTMNEETSVIEKDAYSEIMLFKRGLMNWGSEELIKEYLIYESKVIKFSESGNVVDMLIVGDNFFKALRADMGFNDTGDINLLSIILNAEAREQVNFLNKLND